MKKVLIISYHFPPFNVIASYRAKAYADYLKENGFFATVVTHVWGVDGEEVFSESIVEDRREIRLPRDKMILGSILRWFSRLRILKTIIHYLIIAVGFLDGVNVQFDFYFVFRRFIYRHLKSERYDVVLSIFSPFHHLKLAYEINKKFGIPYVLDFRDLHDNQILNKGYKPSFDLKIQNPIKEYYLRKWMRNALFVTTTSQIWADYLSNLGQCRAYEVLNGFEHEYFTSFKRKSTQIFTISYLGTIHDYQDWDTYFEVLTQFISLENKCVKLNFIGVDQKFILRVNDWKSDLQEKVSTNVELHCLGRVEKKEVINYFSETSLLLLPTLKGRVGMVSGKTLEFIATQIPILAYPNEEDSISSLIMETKSGCAAYSKSEMLKEMHNVYKQWAIDGTTKSKLSYSDIVNFSRKGQVKRFAEILKKELKDAGK